MKIIRIIEGKGFLIPIVIFFLLKFSTAQEEEEYEYEGTTIADDFFTTISSIADDLQPERAVQTRTLIRLTSHLEYLESKYNVTDALSENSTAVEEPADLKQSMNLTKSVLHHLVEKYNNVAIEMNKKKSNKFPDYLAIIKKNQDVLLLKTTLRGIAKYSKRKRCQKLLDLKIDGLNKYLKIEMPKEHKAYIEDLDNLMLGIKKYLQDTTHILNFSHDYETYMNNCTFNENCKTLLENFYNSTRKSIEYVKNQLTGIEDRIINFFEYGVDDEIQYSLVPAIKNCIKNY